MGKSFFKGLVKVERSNDLIYYMLSDTIPGKCRSIYHTRHAMGVLVCIVISLNKIKLQFIALYCSDIRFGI